MRNKLCLGTAQFGLNYGITNLRGKIPPTEVKMILKYAWHHGVKTLDTACTYGESEKIIGDLNKSCKLRFHVVSKFYAANPEEIHRVLKKTLLDLNTKTLFGYLIHDFSFYMQKPQIFNLMRDYRRKGLIRQIGFSLYHPKEAQYLLDHKIDFDFIQIPYSIFDQRFVHVLPLVKKQGKKIYARSVFLQGILVEESDKFNDDFKSITKALWNLKNIAREDNISLVAICLDFVLLNPYIDKVIVGITGLEDLQEDMRALKYAHKVESLYDMLLKFKQDDENILLPFNWKKKNK